MHFEIFLGQLFQIFYNINFQNLKEAEELEGTRKRPAPASLWTFQEDILHYSREVSWKTEKMNKLSKEQLLSNKQINDSFQTPQSRFKTFPNSVRLKDSRESERMYQELIEKNEAEIKFWNRTKVLDELFIQRYSEAPEENRDLMEERLNKIRAEHGIAKEELAACWFPYSFVGKCQGFSRSRTVLFHDIG